MIRGLDHALVSAPPGCEEAGRAFYGDLLGLREIPRPPAMGDGGLWFVCGDAELHVGTDETHAGAAKAHPAFSVDPATLTSLAARLEAAGQIVRWDARVPGVPRFYTTDPFGNRLEIIGR